MPEATLRRTKHPIFLIKFCGRHLAFHLLLHFPVVPSGSHEKAHLKYVKLLFFTLATREAPLIHGKMLPTDVISSGGRGHRVDRYHTHHLLHIPGSLRIISAQYFFTQKSAATNNLY